jgi:hypothetical protein
VKIHQFLSAGVAGFMLAGCSMNVQLPLDDITATQTESSSASPGATLPADAVQISQVQTNTTYTPNASVPKFSAVSGPGDSATKIADGLNRFVEEQTLLFAGSFIDDGAFLDIRATQTYVSQTLFMAEFLISFNLSSNVPPMTLTQTVAFDVTKGSIHNLTDNVAAQNVGALRSRILNALKSEYGDALISDTQIIDELRDQGPRAWRVTKQGLVVLFNPGIVANREVGDVAVQIEWSNLRGVIKPDSIVGKLFADQFAG